VCNCNIIKKIYYAFILLTLFIFVMHSAKLVFCDSYNLICLDTTNSCYTPQIILEKGLNNTSTIYSNGTSAKISIDANANTLTYNYSLNIVNTDIDTWQVRLEYFKCLNISKVNATINLHDNSTSKWQITFNGGNISQNEDYFILASTATMHIGIANLIENSSPLEKTIISTYLRIKTPNTSIYTLYVITFEFT